MTGDAAVAPALTFPPDVAAAVAAAYAAAETILEFGAGGSTVLAAGMPGKRIWTVETDAAFLARMRAWFAAHPPQSPVTFHHADLGPTGAWGRPRGQARLWPSYATAVWDLPGFAQPDVILVDGRFRLAAAMTAALRVTRSATLLFDDYANRPAYHAIERLIRPARTVGRMAVFDLRPMSLPRDLIGLYAQSLTSPD